MATIVRELFGKSPSFLNHGGKKSIFTPSPTSLSATIFPKPESPTTIVSTTSQKNLIELIRVQKNYGKGLKVIPTNWYVDGHHESFYTITKVHLDRGSIKSGTVYGIRTINGVPDPKPVRITTVGKYTWRLYEPPQAFAALEQKLGL